METKVREGWIEALNQWSIDNEKKNVLQIRKPVEGFGSDSRFHFESGFRLTKIPGFANLRR